MSRVPTFSRDATRMQSTIERAPRCSWFGCHGAPVSEDLPICMDHGMRVSAGMMSHLSGRAKPGDADQWPTVEEYWTQDGPGILAQPFVYYLMLSPATVKIGTTRCLPRRIRDLRTEMQYVVALEHGGYEIEHQRHREFATERRHPLREDFHLSDALRRHIEGLQPHHAELLQLATTTHRQAGE